MQVKGNIVLYNTRIYEEENLGPKDFMEKVKQVRRIRTSRRLKFTFFPISPKDMERNERLWEFVNGNLNAMNYDHKYFIIMFPEWLYLFLRYSPQKSITQSIVVALTGLYAGDPTQRQRIEQKLERSLFLKVRENYENHFKEFEDFSFIVAEDWKLADEVNDHYFEKRKRFISRFDYFFRDNCGNPVILPYLYPIYEPRYENSLLSKSTFDIPLVNSYFSKSDWRRIIQGNSSDELIRMESEEEPWAQWKKNFLRDNNLNTAA
jgi:hypothetical protein